MDNQKEKQLATTITDAINGLFDQQKFCDAMSKEHRALQYDFTNLCLNWLARCSDMYDDGNYDARNELACILGKTLINYMKSDDFTKGVSHERLGKDVKKSQGV